MSLPPALASAIEKQVSGIDRKALAAAVEKLSARYRSAESKTLATQSAADRAAYLLTRMPATFAALRAVFSEIRKRVPELAVGSLLDLGAGPGTTAWAAAEIFGDLERVTAVERDPSMLQVAKELASESSTDALCAAQWISGDVASFCDPGTFDLAVVSYTLGELSREQQSALVKSAWEHTGAALAIIEPGTPRGFEVILRARTQLIALGAHMVAPCPHEVICPMSKTPGDWCHFAQRLERSALHRRLKSGTLGYEDEKFSYVVFSRTRAPMAQARVVRHPIHLKGHIKLQLCAPNGLQQNTVGRSERDSFRRAHQVKWGEAWAPKEAL